MSVTAFLDGRVTLHGGDCREVIRTLADASVDSVVTDPPYALVSISKRFAKVDLTDDTKTSQRARSRSDGYARLSAGGFMGKKWDNGEAAFAAEFWAEVLRVLKPGGHVVAFGGTRTYHRLACAIEDAGFEIRDQIGWAYGSGFPKSHNVGKGIDRAAGVEREVIAKGTPVKRMIPGADQNKAGWEKTNGRVYVPSETVPATAAAAEWEGWGTALKPAWEPIVLARKPLIGTVAENVLAHGTGALNIDGCRVGEGVRVTTGNGKRDRGDGWGMQGGIIGGSDLGRWPANIIHDGSDEVVAAFPESNGSGPQRTLARSGGLRGGDWGMNAANGDSAELRDAGDGTAARFFYTAKADAEDRLGSKHPTVKPLDLMQYLVRLVTPPGGLVLDPFAGTGTTGEAAWREGMRAVLIEREPEYQADIARRMELAANPSKRTAVAKSKNNLQGADGTPLFGDVA